MNEIFREFFHTEEINFKNLDETTIVIFDTNTLLNIYRYSNSTRDQLLSIMKIVHSNIWIPYQVGLEFNLNRREILSTLKKDKVNKSTELNKEFKSFSNKIEQLINGIKLKSTDAMEKKKEVYSNFEELLSKAEQKLSKDLEKILDMVDLDTDLASEFGSLFKGKIGLSYDQETLDQKLIDAEERYELSIPPGYEDKNKTGFRYYNGLKLHKKYGDLVLWHQILDKAADETINKVVFITDDVKEDWWYRIDGKVIGPRAELKNELLRKSNADLYMFNSNSFLRQFTSEDKNLIDIYFDENYLGSKEDSYVKQLNLVNEIIYGEDTSFPKSEKEKNLVVLSEKELELKIEKLKEILEIVNDKLTNEELDVELISKYQYLSSSIQSELLKLVRRKFIMYTSYLGDL